ncbi:hypothetical protein CFI10_16830 [Marinobacterium iners]|jgi:hypothetical protein|uniref:DUF6447 family protein n=1 Tax=Marinobacterium iners TaxID=48076 RepID=UPI001A8CB209|nr:DUF6447 family protein [Marinobacterium iners]QSR36616.1 hypothetical protein CFI10_16830 [Marinobacterium iners]
MTDKTKVTIDGVEYIYEELTEAARNQITNLRATEAELNRQQALLGMLQAARIKYVELLKAELPQTVTENEA